MEALGWGSAWLLQTPRPDRLCLSLVAGCRGDGTEIKTTWVFLYFESARKTNPAGRLDIGVLGFDFYLSLGKRSASGRRQNVARVPCVQALGMWSTAFCCPHIHGLVHRDAGVLRAID